jgi:predicted MFS family arabinose efflux permease
MTQAGYGAGLLFIVPLGDLIENRRLVLISLAASVLALLTAAISTSSFAFLAAALFIGLSSAVAQVLVPYAAHLASESVRGRSVGNVMSGLMLGIMLARPVAGFMTQISSWHTIFYLSAGFMVILFIVLSIALPSRVPESTIRYRDLLKSLEYLAFNTPILQRRSLYHACLFGAFSLFWTSVPLLLAGPEFRMTQGGIALFALAGVAGAVATPIAGRVADRGWTRPATAFAMSAAAVAFLASQLVRGGSAGAVALLVFCAILLDFGVAANLTLGQRAIYSLSAEYRSRLNGIYMSTFFLGGAIGSVLGGWAFANGGWRLTAWLGFSLPIAALAYFATERTVPEPEASQ